MMTKKEKINHFKVTPMKLPKDKRQVKGSFLFPKAYASVYILGKKFSGKTELIWNILKARVAENTTVVLFSSTLYLDDAWIEIRKHLKDLGIPVIAHTGIVEKGINTLQDLVHELEQEALARDHERNKPKKKPMRAILDNDDDSDEEEPTKPRLLAADWIIVVDDLSDEIKDKSLETLIKKHRHFHSMLILSNQTLNDVTVSTRKNIDYYLLFRDIDTKKLMEIYKKCSLGISFDKFQELYDDAVADPYCFFYFSTNLPDYRKNFSERYLI
jgi:hypothetical protein